MRFPPRLAACTKASNRLFLLRPPVASEATANAPIQASGCFTGPRSPPSCLFVPGRGRHSHPGAFAHALLPTQALPGIPVLLQVSPETPSDRTARSPRPPLPGVHRDSWFTAAPDGQSVSRDRARRPPQRLRRPGLHGPGRALGTCLETLVSDECVAGASGEGPAAAETWAWQAADPAGQGQSRGRRGTRGTQTACRGPGRGLFAVLATRLGGGAGDTVERQAGRAGELGIRL